MKVKRNLTDTQILNLMQANQEFDVKNYERSVQIFTDTMNTGASLTAQEHYRLGYSHDEIYNLLYDCRHE